ncbi:MAG TPA: hypothetical protein VGW38_17840, partial [Chloroflexota bacterium]|nr:hypothetical protein [Chloroflexota bacterium]
MLAQLCFCPVLWLALYRLGRKDLLSQILRALFSRDHRVQCSVANNIDLIVDEENRAVIVESLERASRKANTIAGLEAINRALDFLQAET